MRRKERSDFYQNFIAHNLTDEMVQLFDRRINLSK